MEEKNLHEIIDIIKNNNFKAYYIIDCDKENFSSKNEVPYEKYCTKYKKLVNNSLFLYRQPKRLAKNRKFSIYGGGIIYKIEEENDIYTAYIKDGFELVPPIMEDDEHLTEMEWVSKKKTNGWDHFWSQYGINYICEEDMLNIMQNSVIMYCRDKDDIVTHNIYEKTPISERRLETNKLVERVRDNKNLRNQMVHGRIRPRDIVASILADLENDKLEFLGSNKSMKSRALMGAERIDKGYDLVSYDEKGNEMHIEIKISTFGSQRLDRVTRRELELFKDPNFYLYSVYNLNEETGEFDFDIKKGTEILEKYDFVPLLYTARERKEQRSDGNE